MWEEDLLLKMFEYCSEQLGGELVSSILDSDCSFSLRKMTNTAPIKTQGQNAGRMTFSFMILSEAEDTYTASEKLSKVLNSLKEYNQIEGTDEAGNYWQVLNFKIIRTPEFMNRGAQENGQTTFIYRADFSAVVAWQESELWIN